MGRQYNKTVKRKRRANYIKRKTVKARQKKAAKAPTASA
jgi:hypothetical protein